jgi:hypothetical protein
MEGGQAYIGGIKATNFYIAFRWKVHIIIQTELFFNV